MTDRTRVAVLGGGVGAMTAAFALSELDPSGKKFDITVYQLGWRLGGKTASGRNAEFGERIEEHGLHIWAGFYDNAFTVLRAALIALDRPPGTPQATIETTFERQNQIFLTEHHNDQWLPWPVWLEPDLDEHVYPGRDSLFTPPGPIAPPLSQIIRRMIDDIEGAHAEIIQHWPGNPVKESSGPIAKLEDSINHLVHAQPTKRKRSDGHPLLGLAGHFIESIENDLGSLHDAISNGAHHLLNEYHDLIHGKLFAEGVATDFRRFLITADLGLSLIKGLLKHDCIRKGLKVLDPIEFRDFLNGDKPISPKTDSAYVRAMYDYAFAYRDGSTPSLSACAAVEGMIRLTQTYKGAFFYKATAGMGDTIFTPIYQVLQKRGVKFKFFHEVTKLELTKDKDLIGKIHLNKQVELTDQAAEYQPLKNVKGLDSWPSEPLWEQLVDGKKLQADGVDFEDLADPLPTGLPTTKVLGEDFDEVVLGISVAALKNICGELIEADNAWSAMVDNLGTNRTQAFQLWLDCNLADLGGRYVEPPIPPNHEKLGPQLGPILTSYTKPFDTYCDMSQLLPAEDWAQPEPQSVAYFCSSMPESDSPDHQEAANEVVKANAMDWMKSELFRLWPNIKSGDDFDWNLLYSPGDLEGEKRFDEQFWQANINLTERYVLALPDTLKYRLEPGQSGFDNLYLAGDWTRVPEINAGCVEVATMSGLAAASALADVDIPVASWDHTGKKNHVHHAHIEQNGPQFANYGGWISLPPPPSVAEDAEFYAWALKADKGKLQTFLDGSINKPLHSKRFKPLLSKVFFMIVKANRLYPEPAPYRSEGTMSETDMGFWILAGCFNGHDLLPEKIGWVPAYLFVDNAFATASGREIWGFPKFVSQISTPDKPRSEGPFSASATVIKHFDSSESAELQSLLTVVGHDVTFTGKEGSGIELFKHLLEDDHSGDGLDQHMRRHSIFPGIDGTEVPVFFLKQFRSACSESLACYQEVLAGGLELKTLSDIGLLEGEWSLTFGDSDSLPFIKELGLGVPTSGELKLQSSMAIWGAMDFLVSEARNL